MKFLMTLVFCLALGVGEAQTFQWAKGMGGLYADHASAVCVDDTGNVYSTGTFQYTADFDPGPGTFNLTGSGKTMYILKLGANGDFKWAKAINGNMVGSTGDAIAIDNQGKLIITGSFEGSIDFDLGPGAFSMSSFGGNETYILKIDLNGNFVWAKQFAGTCNSTPYSFPNNLSTDASGNIYICGKFQNMVDFDTGPGTFILNATPNYPDIFITKIDLNGNLIWAKLLEGEYDRKANSVAADPFGNVFVNGYTKYSIMDFDPGPGNYYLPGGGEQDAFLLKLDVNGDFVWARLYASPFADFGHSVITDDQGNLYSSGRISGIVDFDPGPGTYFTDTIQNGACFIQKIDGNGNILWIKIYSQGGAINNITYGTLKLGANGNIFSYGTFCNYADVYPGPANFIISGSCDVFNPGGTPWGNPFILQLNPMGNFISAYSFGNGTTVNSGGLAIDLFGNVYANGYHSATGDFDPGPNTFFLSADSISYDAFILKLNPCGQNYYQTFSSCDSVIFNGNTFYSDTSLTQLYNDINGCDSNLVTNILINPQNATTINQQSCSSYVLNGQTYTTSGTYYQTIPGCDSVLTLNLIINSPSYFTINETACVKYQLNGQTFTQSGTYTQTLTNAGGCDSIITLNLIIIPVDIAVTQTGSSFVANATGAVYQWLTCNPFQPIAGETNQNFTATSFGDFAVAITQNGCADTSICLPVSPLNLPGQIQSGTIYLHPNPVLQQLNISSDRPLQNAGIKILSTDGKILLEKKNQSGKHITFDLSGLARGIYFIEIADEDIKCVQKIVKE